MLRNEDVLKEFYVKHIKNRFGYELEDTEEWATYVNLYKDVYGGVPTLEYGYPQRCILLERW